LTGAAAAAETGERFEPPASFSGISHGPSSGQAADPGFERLQKLSEETPGAFIGKPAGFIEQRVRRER